MRAGNRKARSALLLICFLGAAHRAGGQEKPPTARQLVARIQEKSLVRLKQESVDTFKAGDPDLPVTGVAVTMMATLEVLQRAAAAGDNLVITHEPTFYSHLDHPEGLGPDDPVWKEKREFIEKHRLVVWRFHDAWHFRQPDGIQAGMVRTLGWGKFQDRQSADPFSEYLFTLPETTLGRLAAEIARRLASPVVRVVGDPAMKVRRVALSPGAAGFENEAQALGRRDVDLLLVGETREWETVEYVADAISEGRKKALIVIGHVPSEQAGMEECARWLKSFLPDLRIEFVPTRQPFWTPGPPRGSRP